jgi:hypothetical protein
VYYMISLSSIVINAFYLALLVSIPFLLFSISISILLTCIYIY